MQRSNKVQEAYAARARAKQIAVREDGRWWKSIPLVERLTFLERARAELASDR